MNRPMTAAAPADSAAGTQNGPRQPDSCPQPRAQGNAGHGGHGQTSQEHAQGP